jgi:HD-GYP domain-containing protein (c-di-GMP phosphodiesterase class II)
LGGEGAAALGQDLSVPADSLPRGLARWFPQPFLGLVLGILALVAVAIAWVQAGIVDLQIGDLVLAVLLSAAIVHSLIYPIHVSRGFKISVHTIPLFLLATLVPPPLAATAAAVALFVGEIAQRHVKGQYISDMASTVGRTAIAVLLGALTCQEFSWPLGLPVLTAAALLFAIDTLTVSLEIGAITGDRPFRVARHVLREGGAAEATLYVIGMVGALAGQREAWSIALLLLPAVLLRRLLKRGMEVQEQTRTLLENMADAVDLRDAYTGGHSRRVTEYTSAILEAMSVRGPEAELITSAARVHDIGKIAIPDRILNKPDRLSDEERAIMESHPRQGADFLARYPDFRRGIDIVLYHHERVDGKGYPAGLRGNDIPFGARVIAVADSFDAMTSNRPYRNGMPVAVARRILTEGRGSQWETAIIDAFVEQVIPTLETVSARPADDEPAA